MKRMAMTFNEGFHHDDSPDTRLDLLNLHSYDDRIKSRQEERKMKDCMLLDFYEHELKSLGSYVDALEKVQNINILECYLRNNVMPVVAWTDIYKKSYQSLFTKSGRFKNSRYRIIFSTSDRSFTCTA